MYVLDKKEKMLHIINGIMQKIAEQITKFRDRFVAFSLESKTYLFLNNALPALLSGYIGAWKPKSCSHASVGYIKIILFQTVQSYLAFLPYMEMKTKKASSVSAKRIHDYLLKSDSTEQENMKYDSVTHRWDLNPKCLNSVLLSLLFPATPLSSKHGEHSAQVR